MPQSLAKNLIHLIYSTKNRTPCLAPEIRAGLLGYKAGILKEWESPALLIGGVADHAARPFLPLEKPRVGEGDRGGKEGVVQMAEDAGSGKMSEFHWQAGYGAFSVSESQVDQFQRYIERQEEHHRTRSFQDEFLVFLKRHGVEYDERYLWD